MFTRDLPDISSVYVPTLVKIERQWKSTLLTQAKKKQVFLDEVFVKMLTCNLFSLWQIVRIYRISVHITLIPLGKTCFTELRGCVGKQWKRLVWDSLLVHETESGVRVYKKGNFTAKIKRRNYFFSFCIFEKLIMEKWRSFLVIAEIPD